MRNVFHIVQFSFVDNKQTVHWVILFRTKDTEGEIPSFMQLLFLCRQGVSPRSAEMEDKTFHRVGTTLTKLALRKFYDFDATQSTPF